MVTYTHAIAALVYIWFLASRLCLAFVYVTIISLKKMKSIPILDFLKNPVNSMLSAIFLTNILLIYIKRTFINGQNRGVLNVEKTLILLGFLCS